DRAEDGLPDHGARRCRNAAGDRARAVGRGARPRAARRSAVGCVLGRRTLFRIVDRRRAGWNRRRREDGWIEMVVRWLTTDLFGPPKSVVAQSLLQPGPKRDIDRHPRAGESLSPARRSSTSSIKRHV